MTEWVTRAGCKIKRDFMFSPNGEDFDFFLTLREKGFKELYYSAPYHWGVLNPNEKKIIDYTEGDVDYIDCETDLMLIKEAEEEIKFAKENYSSSPVVWTEGEELVNELRKKIKL